MNPLSIYTYRHPTASCTQRPLLLFHELRKDLFVAIEVVGDHFTIATGNVFPNLIEIARMNMIVTVKVTGVVEVECDDSPSMKGFLNDLFSKQLWSLLHHLQSEVAPQHQTKG